MRHIFSLIFLFVTTFSVAQQINPVPDYIFRYQMSVGRNAATDTAAYLSIGPRFGAVKGFQPPMVVDTASFSGSKRNGLTIFSVQKNKYVYWDSVGVKWAEMAGTAGNAITGSGTANYVPRFTTSTNLANSGIYQTPGGKIVIGSTTDSASLFNVNGTAKTGTLIVKSTTQEVRIANNFPTGRPGKNIFIGTGGQALITASGDSSSFNTSLGDSAMSSLTSGWQNTAVGFEAMKLATTARSNMAFGHRAMRSLTTGASNVAIGYEAMLSSQTVSNNVAIGSGSMQNTTGNSSVGIGYISLLSQTTGYNNVAVGAETVAVGTTMENTTAVGFGALKSVTGNDNTGVGFAVLYGLTSGSKIVAVGYDAGRYITSGSDNQTSTNSIYIGYDSRASANGNANEIVIGYQGRGNGSNTTTIGNSSTVNTYTFGTLRVDDSLVVRGTNPSAYFNIGNGAPFLSMGWADVTQNHRFRSAGTSNDGLQFELKDTTAKWQISPGGYFATFWGTNDATRIIISDTTTTKIEKGNFIVTNGTIKTKAPTDGTSQPWRLGDYVTTAPSATGYVQVEINGVKYKLLAATY